jgi:hypothetical protein
MTAMNLNIHHTLLLLPAIIISVLAGTLPTKAESVSFTVDPAQSHLTISGSIVGNPIREQGPGSLTTTFSGVLKADLTDSAIQFRGGSSLDAAESGTWQPAAGGAAGSAPADYGALANSIVGTVSAALRNLTFDLFSDPVAISNGSFPATNLVFSFPTNSSAVFDYRSAFMSGTKALAGNSTNQAASVATITTSGSTQTLTITIDGTFNFAVLNPDDSTARFSGQLVATRPLSASGVRITSITVNSGSVRIEAAGGDTAYRLESSADLIHWSSTNVVPTTEPGKIVYTTTVNGPAQFYRLVKP